MAHKIRFKRGTGKPASLNLAEPAVDIEGKVLYIGTEDEGSELITISDDSVIEEKTNGVLSTKEDKPTIIQDTESTIINITGLENNSNVVYGVVSSITVTFPENVGLDYASTLIFSTPDNIEYSNYSTFPSNVYFKGDECENGFFIPEVLTRYTIYFYYDGIQIVALVSGRVRNELDFIPTVYDGAILGKAILGKMRLGKE